MKNKKVKKLKKEYNRQNIKKILLSNKFTSKFIKKTKLSDPDISSITEHIAFIIDDEIVEIMHCQPKFAAILLSDPKIILIPEGTFPKVGWKHIDNNFIRK